MLTKQMSRLDMASHQDHESLFLGIKETPQVFIPEGIIHIAWQRLTRELEYTTFAVVVDGVRMINQQSSLSCLDQFPQEVNHKQRLANPRSTSDDCFVDTRIDP
jgi:hypothetical protein